VFQFSTLKDAKSNKHLGWLIMTSFYLFFDEFLTFVTSKAKYIGWMMGTGLCGADIVGSRDMSSVLFSGFV